MRNLETVIKTLIGVSGATASYLWGEWSVLLQVLVVFVAIDYVTGFMAAAVQGKLKSEVGLKGIAKKVFIFAIVAVAFMIDKALGGDSTLFRDAAIFFYLANEALSILENAGKAGVPVPPKIQQAVEVLRSKGDQ